jgi:hypothetical protein
LKLQGTVNDKIKKCAGYEFRLKIKSGGEGNDDETIAEWFEGKAAGGNGKIMKKIRFPMKFAYLNGSFKLEVTPYIDEKITQKALEKGRELNDYTLCKNNLES